MVITTSDFKEFATARRALVEENLTAFLSAGDPEKLWEAMRYSVLSGGKRLRALLCLASAEATGGQSAIELVMPCACAIEFVHAFSLIHDDLPAMDNDDFRRGRPTNHKVYGEAMAILAGDALFALAFEVLVNKTPASVPPDRLLTVVSELARAAGSTGMVGGQVFDLSFTAGDSSCLPNYGVEAIESMHRRKTGALITFSTWSGAKLAGADPCQLEALGRFGDILGLAFQIADDLLDVTGDIKTLGKTPGKDEASGKATWVRVAGLDQSRKRLAEMLEEGRAALAHASLAKESAVVLESLLDYAINRSN
jgi:geranylgeranyl diphosphate synthase type II